MAVDTKIKSPYSKEVGQSKFDKKREDINAHYDHLKDLVNGYTVETEEGLVEVRGYSDHEALQAVNMIFDSYAEKATPEELEQINLMRAQLNEGNAKDTLLGLIEQDRDLELNGVDVEQIVDAAVKDVASHVAKDCVMDPKLLGEVENSIRSGIKTNKQGLQTVNTQHVAATVEGAKVLHDIQTEREKANGVLGMSGTAINSVTLSAAGAAASMFQHQQNANSEVSPEHFDVERFLSGLEKNLGVAVTNVNQNLAPTQSLATLSGLSPNTGMGVAARSQAAFRS